ncbi:MAG: Trp family transcriptional regulator [bacterium]
MVRVKRHVDRQAFETVTAVLAEIRSPVEIRLFLKELLTPGEVRDITLRWNLLELLADGMPQRQIAEELKISLCKITRGSKILKQKGAVTARVLKARSKKKDTGKGETR